MRDIVYAHTVPGAGTVITYRISQRTPDNRASFAWAIFDEQSHQVGSGAELNSGVGGNPTAREMMPTLLGFLGACAESRQYGSPDSDNWNLFPEAVAEWAAQNLDELELAESELEAEEEDVPQERWRAVEEDEGCFYAVSDAERVGPYSSRQEAQEQAELEEGDQ